MTYTYLQGDQAHTSGPNGTVTRVVIHATVSPCRAGGARANARYFQSAGAKGLAHYVVDPGEIVQCAHEDVATWHAPPNAHSIGVELCDTQSGSPARWQDADHEAMLKLAAKLVADICHRHNLPVVFIGSADLLAGKSGITRHMDVSAAWHKSDHVDPGSDFPMAHFIALVKAAGAPAVTAAPTPTADRWLGVTNPPMRGQDVINVQHALNVAGNSIAESGVYDTSTAQALYGFQQSQGIAERGCGPQTWAALRAAVHN